MLLRVWVLDFYPEKEATLFDTDGLDVLTANERKIIEAFRRQTNTENLEVELFDDARFATMIVKDKPD